MPQLNDSLEGNKNQLLNILLQILSSAPGSPSEAQIYYNDSDKTIEFRTNAAWITLGRLDQIEAPTGSVSFNSQKITSLADGTVSSDAVNLGQLQAALAGLKWKPSVRAATTGAGTLATSFENGDTIDGVALATGDRILIKDQAAPADNGIYVVAASGAPARATDADSGTEVLNAAVFVSEGTTNGNTGWVMTTDGPITLNTTGLVWAQFTGANITAGAGLTLTGSTVDVIASASKGSGGPGGGLKVNANDVQVDFDVVVGKFTALIGDNSTTTIDTTHSLGSTSAQAEFRDASTGAVLGPTVSYPDANTVRSVWSVAPGTNAVRVSVRG